ncbi:MAG: type II secretion system GspH family protein [Pirellulales bacterium]|nr:type II secretion system GspH family protein [Pirellulales bacterium]
MTKLRATKREALIESRCRDAKHGRLRLLRAPRRSQLVHRAAVTLVELLVVITIIATLSTVFLGVSSAAMEQARASRTKALVAKIHTLLMERWETYATRRVGVDLPAGLPGQQAARVRLDATRMAMKLEMPDRWSDILLTSVSSRPPSAGWAPPVPNIPIGFYALPVRYPALSRSYLRRYANLKTNDAEILQANQGAECLYLIVMLATGDGEARTLFGEQDIGDTDGDGALEFVDGWGRSIEFIRWPAGFAPDSALMTGDPEGDHDPIDVFRRDLQAFRLLPLIYSRGPDGSTDMIVDTGAVTGIDPYAEAYGRPPLENNLLATVGDTNEDGTINALDNIHNHLQDNQ